MDHYYWIIFKTLIVLLSVIVNRVKSYTIKFKEVPNCFRLTNHVSINWQVSKDRSSIYKNSISPRKTSENEYCVYKNENKTSHKVMFY